MLGATPNPCPTVTGDVPEALAVTTENPLVVFALTVLVIVPEVLVALEPPAFHNHVTLASLLVFTLAVDPVVPLTMVKPSLAGPPIPPLPNPVATLVSESVALVERLKLFPRTASVNE